MTAEVKYKGYTMVPTGIETILTNNNGYRCPMRRMTYRITCPNGTGLGKAWGMAEAKALVNQDLEGKL